MKKISNYILENTDKKQVNIFPGRFQPFHSGHLKCCEDAYKENGLPVVVMYIHNEKFDDKKPFSDNIIEKELMLIKQKAPYIEDVIWLRRPMPVLICRILKEHGYETNLWLCGDDRKDSYEKLLNSSISQDRIVNELNVKIPELWLTNRYSSATAVRNAIKEDNEDEFKKLMPKEAYCLYEEFKKQLSEIR